MEVKGITSGKQEVYFWSLDLGESL